MKNKTNSVRAKIHQACFKPKKKDDYLVNEALKYVFIDNGMAIASNGSIVVGIDLKSHGISQEIIDHLNGSLIPPFIWKRIIGWPIEKLEIENGFEPHPKIMVSGETISLIANNHDGLKYPDYRTALPWFTGQAANVELMPDFKIDLNLMDIINDCLNPDGDIFPIQLFLYSDNKIIRIMPLNENDKSFVMMKLIK